MVWLLGDSAPHNPRVEYLIDLRACTKRGVVGVCYSDRSWGEGADTIVDAVRVNHTAAFGELVDHIRIAPAIVDIPADHKHDHLEREVVGIAGGARALRHARVTRRAPVEFVASAIPP